MINTTAEALLLRTGIIIKTQSQLSCRSVGPEQQIKGPQPPIYMYLKLPDTPSQSTHLLSQGCLREKSSEGLKVLENRQILRLDNKHLYL